MARPKKVRPITSAEMLEFIDCATLEILEVGVEKVTELVLARATTARL